jgi:EAL domain-containing protein (putative c-di-GMP-specific phosphodiesterase class I)
VPKSSIEMRSFPFDKIKIDRSFIKDLTNGSDAIVQAIITLANSLHMTTTAEGVETEPQAAALRAMGCIEMQGYLFSKPKPAQEIARLLGAHRKAAKPEKSTEKSTEPATPGRKKRIASAA